MNLVERTERWILPPVLRQDWRAAFLFRTWGFGLLFGLAFGAMAVRQQLWWLALAQGSLVVTGLVCLALLRWTARLRLVAHLSFTCVTPVLAFAGLLQSPPNPITPVFCVLVPLCAGFLLSRIELNVWLAISICVGGLAEWLMAKGYYLHGPERPFHGVVTALNLAALVLLVVSFVRWFDATRRDLVTRLEAASRARTVFLANVSHEIRTPVNGVLGLTELVLSGRLEPEQRDRVELVQRSGRSLIALIDDLLLITRAESGRFVLSPAPTAIGTLVGDVIEVFTPAAAERGLRLDCEVATDVPAWIELDDVRWRQVFTNLLSNAVKFTERGAVHVRLFVEGSRLMLHVRDEGPGITAEVLARLFQPFEQADVSTTRRFGGSGLGLAVCRQLVDAMGGQLTVDSVPGRGSCFIVDVPLVPTRAPVRATPTKPLPAHAPTELPVLVVEDNAINCLVTRSQLERAGYRVQVAHNGLEAVEAVQREAFLLVLMDCQMPVMDGLEATRRIRASSVNEDTPIVALTASGMPEELAKCRAAGMNACLVKPVPFEQLVGVVAAMAKPSPP